VGDPVGFALEAAAKALFYGALLVMVGAAATRWLVLPGGVPAASADTVRWTAARVGLIASVLALAALLFRAWAHTVSVSGLAESFSPENLRLAAFESRWGERWSVQALVAAGCISGFGSIWLNRQAGWLLAALSVLFLVFTVPLLGHAAGEPGKLLLHASHIAAAGLWVGTLAVLMMMPRASTAQIARTRFERFSPVALSCAAALAATGAIAVWLYLGAAESIWAGWYGRLLLLKVATVGGVAACGYLNWQSIRSGREPDRPRVIAEVSLACVVVVVTALLTETSPEP
jgi:putative copper export protein